LSSKKGPRIKKLTIPFKLKIEAQCGLQKEGNQQGEYDAVGFFSS
jgi:hypothetical protein